MPFFKQKSEDNKSGHNASPTLLADPHPVGFPPKHVADPHPVGFPTKKNEQVMSPLPKKVGSPKAAPSATPKSGNNMIMSAPSTPPKRNTPKHMPGAAAAASSAVAASRAENSMELRSPDVFVDKNGRRNSQEVFNKRDQTVLLLDWDDTLFPTTWIRMYMGLHWRLPIDEQRIAVSDKLRIKKSLDEIQIEVEKFLNLAVTKGQVIIVTLAREPWVVLSCENFFPRIGRFIREHNIKIVYAQQEGGPPPTNFASELEQAEYWIKKKRNAIAKELALFYQQYEGQSWKNVISIGDSDFERRATFESTREYALVSNTLQPIPADGTPSCSRMDDPALALCYSGMVGQHFLKVRTKTIKMYDGPRIKDLSLEMQLLVKWLPALVNLDSGLDCDFEDDVRLAETHRLLTGEGLP